MPPDRPDIVHCHNLHGEYFDLRELGDLSHRVPLALTLHDEWMFTGHCAYTLGCERWRVGCGSCPDLTIYPAVRRDATRENRRTKQRTYERSRLYVTTPSQWLMDRAQASILAGGVAGWKVIPNGVDRAIFKPGDQPAARSALGLPRDAIMLLFVANAPRRNRFKDLETVTGAARYVANEMTEESILCVVLGDSGPSEHFGNGEVRFIPYQRNPLDVARYMQAADIYLHAANADNLPTTVLEALATGLPVIATAVGGISEEVRSLAGVPGAWSDTACALEEATGVLVGHGDVGGMGAAATSILRKDSISRALAENAVADAARRFRFRNAIGPNDQLVHGDRRRLGGKWPPVSIPRRIAKGLRRPYRDLRERRYRTIARHYDLAGY